MCRFQIVVCVGYYCIFVFSSTGSKLADQTFSMPTRIVVILNRFQYCSCVESSYLPRVDVSLVFEEKLDDIDITSRGSK